MLVAAISLLGLLVVNLFADLLAHRGAYESAGRLLPLLAVLGFAGFIGCSVARLARSPGCALLAGPAFAGPALVSNLLSRGSARESGRWPLLVALLFSPLPVLLSGFGGWV